MRMRGTIVEQTGYLHRRFGKKTAAGADVTADIPHAQFPKNDYRPVEHADPFASPLRRSRLLMTTAIFCGGIIAPKGITGSRAG